MTRLHLLGTPHIDDVPGDSLPLGKPFALLAYLMVSNRPVRRDRLANMFWPNTPPERQRGSLRQALWILKKAIGDDLFASLDLSLPTSMTHPFQRG